jgi:hypothetical protein
MVTLQMFASQCGSVGCIGETREELSVVSGVKVD